MPAHARLTVRRRRLGRELKRLREAAGMTPEEAGALIDGDKTKTSRIENARQGIRPLEIRTLLDAYKVKDEGLRTALLALGRSSGRKSWWRQFGDVLGPDLQERLSLEADAVSLGAFQPYLVPGLLQTQEYAGAVYRGMPKHPPEDDLDALISVRMKRQSVFERDDPPQYVCILDEGVLHRQVGGPSVMADQLEKLQQANSRPFITIQVIPYANGGHGGVDGAFALYRYPDPLDLDVVALDYLDGTLYLEEDAPVEKYRRAFDNVRAAALSSPQSMELISQIMRGFETK